MRYRRDFATSEEGTEFLNGEHYGILVEVKSIKDFTEDEKPYANIVFKVLKGKHKNKILSQRYYDAAPWKIHMLACACGFYRDGTNENGMPVKVLTDEFLEKGVEMCEGHHLLIDTKIEVYKGREITKVAREYSVLSKTPEYPSEEELNNMTDLEELPKIEPEEEVPY